MASHLVGDMTGGTIDDPLFEWYKKLGCSISPEEKDSDDYKMIVKYLEKTYEPYKVGKIVRLGFLISIIYGGLSFVFLDSKLLLCCARVMVFRLKMCSLLN